MDPELVDWFASGIDEGDAPELHLVGLGPGDLERCFAAITALGPKWNDRTFYIDDEGIDVTVHERPEVADLIAEGRVAYACVGAERIAIDGVELPLVEMFLFTDEVHFFWWPGGEWTPRGVAGFFALLTRLLALVPAASLRPDPRYTDDNRRHLGERIGEVIGDPSRVDYDENPGEPQR